MDLSKFFNPKTVVVVGVSRDPTKVGHVLFENMLESGFQGRVYAVNPNEKDVLGQPCFPSVLDIKEDIDLGIIAIPASLILKTVEDCGKKKIKNLIIITAGFDEIGNYQLRDKLLALLEKYKINVVGPNCLGIYDAHTKLDSIFLPQSRMRRPKAGGISLVCQSGALGSALLELGAKNNYGFAKFISYGNAINVDESDLIEYLIDDEETKIICVYIEGLKDGKKFLEIARKASKAKPVIVVKGGLTEEGGKATLSHTGSLAGSAVVYEGAFKQAGVIYAKDLEEMFEFAKIFTEPAPKGTRIQVITNGGGYGVLCTDAIIENNMKMAVMEKQRQTAIAKQLPGIAVVKNPLDLTGSAKTEWYDSVIKECMADRNVDIILVVILYQTPLITEDIVDIVLKYDNMKKKPMVVISTGAEFTEKMTEKLEERGVPTYTFPGSAVKSIRKLVDYYSFNS